MSKKLEFNDEARKKLLAGATKLKDAVVSTLGPHGRNVISFNNGEVYSTKDGASIAKQITLEDPIENIGAEVLKQASIKTATQAGDGSTTTTLLAHAIISEGIAFVNKGANATEIKKDIDLSVKKVVTRLKELSEEVSSEKQLENVATISANNDEITGKLITKALEKVGRDGVVTIEESKTGETYLETVEGMQFDRGYKSPYFVTNNDTMQSILDTPRILIYNGIISGNKELIPLLGSVNASGESLLIVAEDIGDEALAVLIVNKMKGIIKACAVKAPDFGERRTLLLEDLAILTGGVVVSKEKGMNLEQFQSSWLGKADRVTITKDKTTVIDGKGATDKIEKRAIEIKAQLDKSTTPFETEKLQERLAKLTSGISIVYVGGANEIEMKEYKDRVEDSLFATRAAIEEGILPGGGVALFHARETLAKDNSIGAKILYKALSKPFTQILENAGKEEVHQYSYALATLPDKWMGYDLKTDGFKNFKTLGILDPVKVVRVALENAAAVAGIILTSECVIYTPPVEIKKEEEQQMY